MKKLILLLLLVLVASVWAAGKIMQDPGYLLISYQNTTVETSLWVGLVILAIVILTVHFSIIIITKFLSSGTTIQRWSHTLKNKRSAKKTTKGLIDYIEGNFSAAQKRLSQTAKTSETPLINYLTAARAAAKNGDTQATDELLRKAHDIAPNASLAIDIAKAEIQIQQQQPEQALASLIQLCKSNTKHRHLHELLYQVYLDLNDWTALGNMMPTLRKLNIMPTTKIDALEQKIIITQWQHLVRDNKAKHSLTEVIEQLNKEWKKVAVKLRRHEKITMCYVQLLKELDKPELAELPLKEAINQQWSESLINEYGLTYNKNLQAQLTTAEGWLKNNTHSAGLMLALARLSLKNKLWGKAREYFQECLKLKSSVIAHAELARLLKALGEEENSNKHILEGFNLMGGHLPLLPMPDQVKRIAN